ncbi:MAG: hypothetical protein HY392_00700 [Candidatus Diapherotrites archaeon]|nr:hypothetical protein [Candidatus Diapherotrites archaeon]
MKNQVFVVFALLVFSGGFVVGEAVPHGEPDNYDWPTYFVTPQDSPRSNSESPDSDQFPYREEKKGEYVARIENGEFARIVGGQDDNSVEGQNHDCQSATTGLYGGLRRDFLDFGNDVDWFTGTRSGQGYVRVVMVPPNTKNYDIEIYDECGGPIKSQCGNGRGDIDSCHANVNGSFFVKVYTVGGDYSAEAPFYVMAYNWGACSFQVSPGRPTKEGYDCHETIRVDNTLVHNLNNDTFTHMYNQDLWSPSGIFQDESEYFEYSIPPNQYAWWDAWHNPPPNGWPENGFYAARGTVIGYCENTDTIIAQRVNASPTPQVSCQPCQDECSYNGQKRCNGNNSETCGNYDGDNCLEWGGGQYCSQGCNQQNGQCNSCESHHHEGCFDNDVYWFNSCNEREERKEDCRVSCNFRNNPNEYYCVNGCLGNFAVTARNQRGVVEQNAAVSFRRPDQQEFQFAGLINSQGLLNFSDLWPRECGVWYEVKAVTANGGNCGVKPTWIEKEGDRDGIMFTCPIVNNDNFLRVSPDGPERIKLGQILDLRALITDRYYTPVSGALVGVNRPYDPQPLSDTTNDQGNASFLDDRVPAGSHNFQFIGSKIGYNYGEAWKRVTVEPQQVQIAVRDNLGHSVWHAEVLLEGVSKGFTDNEGRLTVQVEEQVNTFQVKNTNGIDCGYRTVKIGEQANFICSGNPVLRVEVDNNHSLPLANVVVALDGNFVDFTTVFGYTVSTAPSGEHLVEIYYKFDENSYAYRMSQPVDIDESLNVVNFVADQEHGEIIEEENLSIKGLTDGNVSGQFAFIPVVLIAVDLISIYLSIEDTCDCLVQHNNNPEFYMDYCKTTLSSVYLGGLPALVAATTTFRVANVEVEQCPVQYAGLLFDVSPGTGAGILKKIGVMAFAAKVANRLPLNEVKVGLKYLGQKLKSEVISELEAKLIGHEWDYYIKFDEAGKYIKQIWLRTGYKLFKETSEYLDDKLISVGIRPVQRTLDGIGFNVIPDQIEYVQRMLDYAVKAFKQGFDPLGNGVHQLQKLFKRNSIKAQVGEEFVENTITFKKGIHYGPNNGFGWEHIVGENHHNQIREVLDLSDADESVKDVIKEVVETARNEDIIYIPGEAWEIRKTITRNGKSKDILVVVSDRPGNVGSIQTARPD